MIISYPTGLYSGVLPHAPADGGNVSFTVSGGPPPRTALSFPKIPTGVGHRLPPARGIPAAVRRAAVGELAYTSTSASTTAALASSTRQYQLGDVLDFSDAPDEAPGLDPLLAGAASDNVHDAGLLDYGSMGLSAAQQAELLAAGAAAYAAKQAELADAARSYLALQTRSTEVQKLINEADKALAAVVLIGGLGQIVASLAATRAGLLLERAAAVAAANLAAAAAGRLRSDLLSLSQIVR